VKSNLYDYQFQTFWQLGKGQKMTERIFFSARELEYMVGGYGHFDNKIKAKKS